MHRRTCLLALAGLPLTRIVAATEPTTVAAGTETDPAIAFDAVLPGRVLRFPDDEGAHPGFRTEWWYVTGWLKGADDDPLGFQITFFRVRTGIGEDNPSAFAPRQLLLAHAAIADPRLGRLRHDQRAARVGFERAGYATDRTHVWLDDWSFEQSDQHYATRVNAEDFAYDLRLAFTGAPMLNGDQGFSRKAPDPHHASYYYSRPHLQVEGRLTLDGRRHAVSGRAWMDHEWSSAYSPEGADGWDWVGLNLDDGGALMAFRMRRPDGTALWAGATRRFPDGRTRSLAPEQVEWLPLRRWRSPRTGIEYPVEWSLRIGDRRYDLRPLMDDQELDSRRSTNTLYWEGAIHILEAGREIGRGYLEMTGYGDRIQVG
ncbi:lipocalin-like domain-containing protein [Allochromatium vinosum]|uniref:lipocalin-like domain-containing protein n=1 Tax=Allochromatium vinosum TaxID=1049 RepID=UPI0019072F5B|nr:carotenoid 1,2-hydratase [Allochromatium vinosum]MBK1655048.1 carotenoid 1,2-hydratase [Allochromatium vinosum]